MTGREARNHPIAQLAADLHARVARLRPSLPGNWFDQCTRALISTGSNYCEGWGSRDDSGPTKHKWRIARGEAYEAAWQLSLLDEMFHDLVDDADRLCDMLDAEVADNESTMPVRDEATQ